MVKMVPESLRYFSESTDSYSLFIASAQYHTVTLLAIVIIKKKIYIYTSIALCTMSARQVWTPSRAGGTYVSKSDRLGSSEV